MFVRKLQSIAAAHSVHSLSLNRDFFFFETKIISLTKNFLFEYVPANGWLKTMIMNTEAKKNAIK